MEAGATSGAMSALDALYKTAQQTAGKWMIPIVGRTYVPFWVLFSLPETRSLATLLIIISCCESDHRQSPAIPHHFPFGCVHPAVRILHRSFPNFISNRVRCGTDTWVTEPTPHNCNLAIRCLCLMQGILKHNTCVVTGSHQLIIYLSDLGCSRESRLDY